MSQIEELRSFFRRDFDLVPSLKSQIDASYNELVKLTQQQIALLDKISSPRLLVKGGAGTGKTLIALEKARRHARSGKRVLFLCFNQLLAKAIQDRIHRERLQDLITANTLHAFCRKTIFDAGMDHLIPNNVDEGSDGYFREVLPTLFPQAFCDLYDTSPFDVLIVDEGQDFKNSNEYIETLDWLIDGGLKEGNWAWFEDDRQAIFSTDTPSNTCLESFASTTVRLTENCRNTSPVATFVSLATSTDLDECLVKEGPQANPIYFSDAEGEAKVLHSTIKETLANDVPPAEIIIINASGKGSELLRALPKNAKYELDELTNKNSPQKGKIGYTTAGRFKGLESRAVIVTNIESLESGTNLRRLYVAMTRANAYLMVLLREDLKDTLNLRASEFAQSIMKTQAKNQTTNVDSSLSPGAL